MGKFFAIALRVCSCIHEADAVTLDIVYVAGPLFNGCYCAVWAYVLTAVLSYSKTNLGGNWTISIVGSDSTILSGARGGASTLGSGIDSGFSTLGGCTSARLCGKFAHGALSLK